MWFKPVQAPPSVTPPECPCGGLWEQTFYGETHSKGAETIVTGYSVHWVCPECKRKCERSEIWTEKRPVQSSFFRRSL